VFERCYSVQVASDLPYRKLGVVHPVTEYPRNHPVFDDPVCGLTGRTDVIIRETEKWNQKGNQVCDESDDTYGGAAFYAYKYPVNFASNNGYIAANTALVFLVEDDSGAVYFMLVIDDADDNIISTPDGVNDGFCEYVEGTTDLIEGYSFGEACNDDGGTATLVVDSPDISTDPYSLDYVYFGRNSDGDLVLTESERWYASRWVNQDFGEQFSFTPHVMLQSSYFRFNDMTQLIVQDDSNDFKNAKDEQAHFMDDDILKNVGNGVTNWLYAPGKSDGVMIGLLPDEFCFNFDIHDITGLTTMAIADFVGNQTVQFSFSEDIDVATLGTKICGLTCTDYCAQFTSCGQCASGSFDECGWCESTQSCLRFDLDANCPNATEYFTPRNGRCTTCAAHTTASDCLSEEQCGWCYSSASCISAGIGPNWCTDAECECTLNGTEVRQMFDEVPHVNDVAIPKYCPGAVDVSMNPVDAETTAVYDFCNGHGTCDWNASYTCSCDAGWYPATGSGACASFDECGGNGDRNSQGQCVCNRGYTGPACNSTVDGGASSQCLVGTTVVGVRLDISDADSKCSGSHNGSAIVCRDGFYGADCSSTCPNVFANTSLGDPCGPMGTCDDGPDGTGDCTCETCYMFDSDTDMCEPKTEVLKKQDPFNYDCGSHYWQAGNNFTSSDLGRQYPQRNYVWAEIRGTLIYHDEASDWGLGYCDPMTGEVSCHCPGGYGRWPETTNTSIGPCDECVCQNGGICNSLNNDCDCPDHVYGKYCQFGPPPPSPPPPLPNPPPSPPPSSPPNPPPPSPPSPPYPSPPSPPPPTPPPLPPPLSPPPLPPPPPSPPPPSSPPPSPSPPPPPCYCPPIKVEPVIDPTAIQQFLDNPIQRSGKKSSHKGSSSHKRKQHGGGPIRKLLFAGLPPELKLPLCDFCPGDEGYDPWLPYRPRVKFAPEEFKLVDRDLFYDKAAPLPSKLGPFPNRG